jgi:hypothetical protein
VENASASDLDLDSGSEDGIGEGALSDIDETDDGAEVDDGKTAAANQAYEPSMMEDVDLTGRRISYCFERDGASASGKVSVWEDGTIRSSLARWPNWYSVRFDKDGLSDVLMTDENEGDVWRWASGQELQLSQRAKPAEEDLSTLTSEEACESEPAEVSESLESPAIDGCRHQSDDEAVCAICLDDLVEQSCCETLCGHRFHCDCMDTWLEQGSACPLCMKHVVRRRLRQITGLAGALSAQH